MSEALGRRISLFSGVAGFVIFQIPIAAAQNITTICVTRFLGGFCASSPLAVMSGFLADIWDPIPRGYAIGVFASGAFAGPVAGLTESSLCWRRASWITLILAGAIGIINPLVVPETSAARILQFRAAKLRKETGNAEYRAAVDRCKLSVKAVITVYLIRPFVMAVQEPTLLLITAYMSLLYGIIYLLFEAVSPYLLPQIKTEPSWLTNLLSIRSPSSSSAASLSASPNFPSQPSLSASSSARA